ncbi:uncharacterized protein LOC121427323 [Lytechinus variegatus]|uniref:uncharacterized protein LOC121427323 n=1 Tax=Lytechinus variegatus TaxID=7654 RepID=UPI001BB19E9F|nr:uncharacterized protein LOC121427323 [Lytechinus variegatus]
MAETKNGNDLGRGVTDKDILDISRTISYDHLCNLGQELGIGLTEVQNLKKQYRDDAKEIAIIMFQKWRARVLPDGSTMKVVKEMMSNITETTKDISESDELTRITTKLSVKRCRERLIDHYRKTCKIALKPWDKTNYAGYDDLHTRISLLVSERGQRGGDEVKKVTLPGSINDIFKTEVDGSLPNRILMIGGAGIGKTTSLAKLAYDWAHGAEDSPLKDVPLVFALKFRRSGKHTSLGEAIVKQLLGKIDGVTPQEIEKFIDENEEDCVILLDGYDEYNGSITSDGPKSSLEELLLYQRFRKCRVLISCRPHRQEDFDIDELPFVYAKVEIEGFSEEDYDNYIDRFFDSKVADATGLKNYLKEQVSIGSLINIPFFCMAFCVLWKGQFLQDTKSHTALFNSLLKYLLEHARSKSCVGFESLVAKPKKGFLKSVVSQVGRVALNSLLSDSRKLLFEQDDFEDCLHELDIAVEIGLVSKQAVIEESSDWDESETVFVEFYHKLAQEHCAGVYLSTLDQDKLLGILKCITTESRVLDLENVLKFAAGSSDKVCLTILKRFETISWSTPLPYLHAIGERSQHHRLVFDILCESTEKLTEQQLTSTILPYFKDGEFHFVETSSSRTVYGFARIPLEIKAQIMTMVISFCELSEYQVHLLWKSLNLCKSLEKLDLKGCHLSIDDTLDKLCCVRRLDMMGVTTDHHSLLASLPNVEEIRISNDHRTRSDSFMKEIVDGLLRTNGRQTVVELSPMYGFTFFSRSTCISSETVSYFIEHTLPHMTAPRALVLEVPIQYDDMIRIIVESIRRPTIIKLRFFIDVESPLCSANHDGDHPDDDLAPHGIRVTGKKFLGNDFTTWSEHYRDLSTENTRDLFWVYVAALTSDPKTYGDSSFEHMLLTLQRPRI